MVLPAGEDQSFTGCFTTFRWIHRLRLGPGHAVQPIHRPWQQREQMRQCSVVQQYVYHAAVASSEHRCQIYSTG